MYIRINIYSFFLDADESGIERGLNIGIITSSGILTPASPNIAPVNQADAWLCQSILTSFLILIFQVIFRKRQQFHKRLT